MSDLSAFKARPFVKPLDISGASFKSVVDQYSAFTAWLEKVDGEVISKPEHDAIAFYMANHAMSLVAQKRDEYEPLGVFESVADDYHAKMQAKALRMFFYLLIICTRESRHAYKDGGLKKVYDMYPNIAGFHKEHVEDTSADDSVKAMLNHAPDVTLGEYVNFLHDIFVYPKYSGGYGGKAWKECAFPLREMVWGRISAEMFLDTGFTLCHNGGPIFNKGMLYHTANTQELQKILDVQRAGQIPQLVASKATKFVTGQHTTYQKKMRELIGGEFDGYVDWFVVESLGSVGKYPTEKQAQKAKHGVSGKQSQAEKVAELMAKIEKDKADKAQADFEKMSIEVAPGIFVTKINRGASAS